MSLISLIITLLLEHKWPSVWRWQWEPRLTRTFTATLNSLVSRRGPEFASYFYIVVLFVVFIGSYLLSDFFYDLGWVLTLLFNITILYGCMGIRQASRHLSEIQELLIAGKNNEALIELNLWQHRNYGDDSTQSVTRLSIEHSILSMHRLVFAPIFWFLLMPGVSGLITYVVSDLMYLTLAHGRDDKLAQTKLAQTIAKCHGILDYLPARVTAIVFALAGNLENAVRAWREQGLSWQPQAQGIILASAAGSLGIILGMPALEDEQLIDRPTLGDGQQVDLDSFQSMIALFWRALIGVLAGYALICLAFWAGG